MTGSEDADARTAAFGETSDEPLPGDRRAGGLGQTGPALGPLPAASGWGALGEATST